MVATVITEAVSSMMGWLEIGLDFHASKDEETNGGHVGGLGLKRCAPNGVGFVDENTRHEGGLARTHPGHRRLRGRNNARRSTDGWPESKKRMPNVKFYRKYEAITSKRAKAGLVPSGLRGMRCVGMPPTRVKAFKKTIGRCLPGIHAGRSLTWRLAIHECDPIHTCRVEPNRGVGRGSLGRAAG